MRWLHFSDFHVGTKPGPQADALASLVHFIRETCTDEVDAIFLVGDIAYSGQTVEYERFETEFLRPLLAMDLLKEAKVFAVPGNHDVDCDAASPISWESIKERNQGTFFNEDEEGRRTRRHRTPVFGAYQRFVERNGILSPNPHEQVSVLHHADGRIKFDILTVNTSFFSDKDEPSDEPFTPCPLPSIRHHLRKSTGGGPVIVLGHHPHGSFLPDQQQQFETTLIDHHAVYLHGHEHLPKLASNTNGTVRCIGFGATYLASLSAPTKAPYKNTFAIGHLTDQLRLNSYTWDCHVGRWAESTKGQFVTGPSSYDGSTLVLSVPRRNGASTRFISKPLLQDVPRRTPQPQSISLLSEASVEVWKQLLALSDSVRSNFSGAAGLNVQSAQSRDGKIEMMMESGASRDLLVCIPGASHMLSAKEVESYNTRLDTEGFRSVTVLSLGKISGEARDMYSRLRTRKAIEILVNKELASRWTDLLSPTQAQILVQRDAARHTADILIADDHAYLLVVDSTDTPSFQIFEPTGLTLPAHHSLVATLRGLDPGISKMAYGGSEAALVLGTEPVFDENAYLKHCYAENNVLKYAALANVGVRFSDFSLDQVYVDASASEADNCGSDRLHALLDDHLAAYPASDKLKEQIKQKLLSESTEPERHETSRAREFCQRYGAVLLTGDPGSGKTCFVKSEILAYARRARPSVKQPVDEWHSLHVPLLVQLSQAAAEPNLQTEGILHIAARLLERRGVSFPVSTMEELLKQGRLALFFDGLDEVVSVERRAQIVQHINDVVTQRLSAGNRIVVTSRPAAVNVVNLLPTLRRLELQGLTETEIRTLAGRVLTLRLAEADDRVVVDARSSGADDTGVVRQIVQDCREKPGVARLAQNPLLLTLLVMIYANSGAPSAKRHRIYDDAIRTLASVRGRQTGHDPVSAQDLRERLGAVALSVYRGDTGFLPTRSEVAEVVRIVMTRQRGEPVSKAEADRFIQRVAESTGVIALGGNEGKGDESAIVTFMHHSFMEYFAAVGLSRDLDKVNVAPLVNQPRWAEILTLLAGLIGETEDVAPILARFIGPDGSRYGDVDANQLLFSLDCALECEVPSEAAIRLLMLSIHKCLERGPGRADPWVRSQIGQRLSQLIASCGISAFEGALAGFVGATDADLCAAAIGLVAHSCTDAEESAAIRAAIESACVRTEENIHGSLCEVASRVTWLRTPTVLQVIGRCLRGSRRSKRFGFEGIVAVPGLAAKHWPDIINALEDDSEPVRRLASRAAVQAGLDGDIAALSDARKDVVANALQNIHETGTDHEYPSSKVRIETLDVLMRSTYERDRLIGIQLIPAADSEGTVAFPRLMEILRESRDRAEVAAALRALRYSRNALLLFTVNDIKPLTKLCVEGTADVRIGAIHILSHFVTDTGAVRTLLDRDFDSVSSDEFAAIWNALGRAEVLHDEIVSKLEKQLSQRLHDTARKNRLNTVEVCALLDASQSLCRNVRADLASSIRDLIGNYRVDEQVQRAALRAYPAVALPNRQLVEFITERFRAPIPQFIDDLVHTPNVLAKHCRQSIDFVTACVEAMGPLRDAASALHQKLLLKSVTGETVLNITTLRDGIRSITQIIVTFDEFINANSLPWPDSGAGAGGHSI